MQKVFQKTALVALVAAIIMCLGMLMATMAWADATSTQNEPAATTATANNQDNSNATESTSSDGINLLNSLMNTSGSQSSDTQTVETQTTDSQTDNTIPPLPAEVTEIIENQDAQVQVEAVQTEDTAGNVFVSGGALDKTLVNDVKTGDFADIYLFGGDLMVEDATIGGDVIAAIDRMDVQKTTVGGSVRAAGNTITIDEVTAKGNATIAGNSVVLGGLAKFNAVYIAARDVSFNGEAKAFSAAGETVVMNGKVDGDVRIFANKVVIGRNAVVTGTMYISSPTIPEVPETAQISAMEFYETGSVDVNENIKLSWAPTIPDFTDTNYWIQVGIVALYCLVIAILLALFLRGAVENSARIARERTGALIISGIVGTIL
ncbi:MAG: hypothetical protein IKE43_04485 [Coriobacteriales bacterium]|nr:hypothetical protein [Coriobacteriales bacterium]